VNQVGGYPQRLISSLYYSKPWGSIDAVGSEWD
jgi:hypothetical protein